MRRWLWLAIVLLALVAVAAYVAVRQRAAAELDRLGPEEVVATYYQSLARGDLTTAHACLSDDLLKRFAGQTDDDFETNLQELTNIQVSPARPIPLYGKNAEEVQVRVEFDVVYKRAMTEDSGHHGRFVYVARATPNAPWRIISIGTGP